MKRAVMRIEQESGSPVILFMPILSGADMLAEMVDCEDDDLFDQWDQIQEDHGGGLKFSTEGHDEVIGWYTYEMSLVNGHLAMEAWKEWFTDNDIKCGSIQELSGEEYEKQFP